MQVGQLGLSNFAHYVNFVMKKIKKKLTLVCQCVTCKSLTTFNGDLVTSRNLFFQSKKAVNLFPIK